MSRSRGQRGAAGSVVVAAVCLTLVSAFMAGAVLIQWFFLARRAEQVAEIAALAAVGAAVRGDTPCRAAADAAGRNATTVASCDVRGEGRFVVVEVVVSTPLRPSLGWGPSEVHRSATAGT